MRFGIGTSNKAKTYLVTSFLVPGLAHPNTRELVLQRFCTEISHSRAEIST